MYNAEISRAVREASRPLREQRDAWKRSALGVLALSTVGSMLMSFAHCSAREAWQEREQALRAELQHAEAVRDQAVQELGELANSVALDKQARQEQTDGYEALGTYQYIGECTITAYCPCEECCGEYADGLTATGFPALPGVVAVDPEIIPLGSTVIIDGLKYLAADTGVTGYHVDICVMNHRQAEALGVRTEEVWVAKP